MEEKLNTMAIDGGLFKAFRKGKVNYPWLPPLQLQSPRDFLVLSRCSRDMIVALEEIREGLVLMECPAFASMKLLHVPGTGGESGRQVEVYCRFRGWQSMMKEAKLTKERDATQLYARGEFLKQIARSIKTRDERVRFHIVKGLQEYTKLFDIGNAV